MLPLSSFDHLTIFSIESDYEVSIFQLLLIVGEYDVSCRELASSSTTGSD